MEIKNHVKDCRSLKGRATIFNAYNKLLQAIKSNSLKSIDKNNRSDIIIYEPNDNESHYQS